jgi:CRP-like cAMP-binding protein
MEKNVDRIDVAGKIKTLRAHREFSDLPEKLVKELATMASRRIYKRNEIIFHSGDTSHHCYIVESGSVLLSKESPSGKPFSFLLSGRGATLNAVTNFFFNGRFFSARATEEASLLVIPSSNFNEWVLGNREISRNIINTLEELLDTAYQRIIDLINESVEQRIINLLFNLSSRLGRTLPLTNKDLADMTGTSRETACRVIHKLQDAGLVSKSRGKIKILDLSQLESLSSSIETENETV